MRRSITLGFLAVTAAITMATADSSDVVQADAGQRRGSTIHNITQGTFHFSIQEAIVAAVGGDVIEVSGGEAYGRSPSSARRSRCVAQTVRMAPTSRRSATGR